MFTNQPVLTLVAWGSLIMAGVSASAQVAGPAGQAVAPGVPQVRQFLQQQPLSDVRASQLLGIPLSNCQHVIELMMHNRLRGRLGVNGTEQLHLPHLSVGLQPGDLQLTDVHLVCDGDHLKGPIFQLGLKNCSNVPIGNFHVSLVGVLCQIQPHSPSATICIPRMEAGEQTQIQIQLPVTCMAMGPLQQRVAFDTLVVAVDSFDILLECDELNNVQILRRGEIPLLTPVVAQTPVAPAAPAPQATPVAPAPPAPAPAPERKSPLDDIDLDQLDLDSGDGQQARSLRFPG